MSLDKESQHLLQELAKTGGKPLHESTPVEAREFSEALSKMQEDHYQVYETKENKIPVENGEIEIYTIKPAKKSEGIIVYYHGGGWVIGKAESFQVLGKKIANETGCAVVLVDYRKAPEHPYPIPVNDSYTALTWINDNMEAIAGAKVPLMVAGDSAGGNLAAIMAHISKEKGPSISLQLLIYPVTNDDLENKTYTDPENQLLLEKRSMEWFWDHYAPNLEERKQVNASPLYAKDFTGLPPAVVITAGHDVLREEGEAYAIKLMEAGIEVTFKRFADQMHGFFTMVDVLPGSNSSINFIATAIKHHLKTTHQKILAQH